MLFVWAKHIARAKFRLPANNRNATSAYMRHAARVEVLIEAIMRMLKRSLNNKNMTTTTTNTATTYNNNILI